MPNEQERILSVFELAQGLKRTVENATAGRWVEGEVGRLQRPASGHLYFTLKDEKRDATVDCVMYKRDAYRFGKRLTEGGRVQLRGRASFYPPRGRLQWIAEVARPAGQGALLEALARLKAQLIDEGLTAPERKRPLPRTPRVVGVVTSRSGAAFSDIVKVAMRRGSVRLLLSPARVQGDGAAASLVEALDLLEKAKPDVIILGRGGGSAEDLMAFNDERLVRRVAACTIPIVSAVGHEVDTSLTDLVADARAATPSQAAELVVPDQSEQRVALRRMQLHLRRAMKGHVTEAQLRLSRLRSKVVDPRFVIADEQQSLDNLRMRLEQRMRARLQKENEATHRIGRRLDARHPRTVLNSARSELSPLKARLEVALRRRLDERAGLLRERAGALNVLSPLSVLGRGYALCTVPGGGAVREATQLARGDPVTVTVRKGAFEARVEKVTSSVENHAGFEHETRGATPKGENSA